MHFSLGREDEPNELRAAPQLALIGHFVKALKHFGSSELVKAADEEQLTAVKGRVKRYYEERLAVRQHE
ncbi:MAG: hypothetical protein ABSH50_07875 [Bryobacteraceae bacterium]|jgi:hypothetical protein